MQSVQRDCRGVRRSQQRLWFNFFLGQSGQVQSWKNMFFRLWTCPSRPQSKVLISFFSLPLFHTESLCFSMYIQLYRNCFGLNQYQVFMLLLLFSLLLLLLFSLLLSYTFTFIFATSCDADYNKIEVIFYLIKMLHYHVML